MKGLDLRKFKKLHSTEHVTTLVHPDGHKISIAHNKVKPELAEQMKNLPKFADGGWVDSVVKTVKESFEDAPKPKSTPAPQAPSQEDAKKMQKVFGDTTNKYAKGGVVKHYYEGTPDSPVGSVLDDSTDGGASADWTDNNNNAPSMVPPTDVSSMTSDPNQQQAIKAASEPAAMLQNRPNVADDLKMEQSNKASEPDIYSQVQQPQQAAMPIAQPGYGGVIDQINGIQGEANAVSEASRAEAKAAAEHTATMQQLQAHWEQKSAAIQQEIANVTHDYQNGHIDPDHFWNSKSDLGKISTAIGLILGGIGGGMTHQENPALKFLNAQIDRDIESQKMQMNNQHNLLSVLNQQFGNMEDATKMAKLMYADIYASKITDAAAKSKDPIAQARALQAKGQILAPVEASARELALKQTVLQAANQGLIDPSLAVQHAVPKEHQKEVFDEIQRAQDTRKSADQILKAFDSAASGKNIVDIVPGMENADQKSLHALLGPTFKDVEGTVRQAAMDNMFKNITPQFGDWATTTQKKRAALQGYLDAKSSAPTAKGYGINLDQIPSTRAAPKGFNPRK